MNEFSENIKSLLEYTAKKGVKLIAVTKTVSVEKINEAISCGVSAIGENKVQELLSKYDQLNKDNLEIHLIGALQSNKVKYIIDKVDLIHSVDNLKLAQTIDKYALKHNKIQDVLVQINISKEDSKGGIFIEDTLNFLEQLSHLENLKVRGFMCIPSPESVKGENSFYFKKMHKLFVDINNKKLDNICMDVLSMGMSGDYETAIDCGATAVRIGTKIFGKRNYMEV